MDMAPALVSGVFWTIVYILTIKRDVQDKSYGMPLAALAINLAWETRFSWLFPLEPGHEVVQTINTVWMVFDVIIAVTFFLYGYRDFTVTKKHPVGKLGFYFTGIIAFVFAYSIMFTSCDLMIELSIFGGDLFEYAKFFAFIQNFMMSVLFVVMFWSRGNLNGQSLYIALAKWLGTLAVGGFSFFAHLSIPLWALLIVGVEIFDIWYIVLVYWECKREGINPWKRF